MKSKKMKTKKHLQNPCKCLISFVIPIGFEPMTYCLEGSCSIQLSYGTVFCRDDKIRTCDLFVPNEARYRAAPYPVIFSGCKITTFFLIKSNYKHFQSNFFVILRQYKFYEQIKCYIISQTMP